jgi:hypothetical protein
MTQVLEINKPAELLALGADGEAASGLFDLLKRWFQVGDDLVMDLSSVDAADDVLDDPRTVTAAAMRKLQALRYAASPGHQTATDVVLCCVADVLIALSETFDRLQRCGLPLPDDDEEIAQFEHWRTDIVMARDAVISVVNENGLDVIIFKP